MFQVQVPVFCTAQVFVNAWPGVITVPSGIVTSLTYAELSHPCAATDVELAKTKVFIGSGVVDGLDTGVVVGERDACCSVCWTAMV